MPGDRAPPRATHPRLLVCWGVALLAHVAFFSLLAGVRAPLRVPAPDPRIEVITLEVSSAPVSPVPVASLPAPVPVARARVPVTSVPVARAPLPVAALDLDSFPDSALAPISQAESAHASEPRLAPERAPLPDRVPPRTVDVDVAHAAASSGRMGAVGRTDRVSGLAGIYGEGNGVARLHRTAAERAELEGDPLAVLAHPLPTTTLTPFAGEGPGAAGRWYYERLSRHFTARTTGTYGFTLSGEAAAVVLLHELDDRHRPVRTWRLIDRMTPDPGARERLDRAATASLAEGVEYLVDVLSVYRVGAAHVDLRLGTPDGEEHGFLRLHPRRAGTPVRQVLERNAPEHVSPYAGAQAQ